MRDEPEDVEEEEDELSILNDALVGQVAAVLPTEQGLFLCYTDGRCMRFTAEEGLVVIAPVEIGRC